VARLNLITMCGTIRSLKSTFFSESFIFDLHGKFLFLAFAARRRNIFCIGLVVFLNLSLLSRYIYVVRVRKT
jgi:hypothetical protein